MRAARHSIWARAKDRSGLERPQLWGLSAAQRLRGVAPAHSFVGKHAAGRRGIGMLLAIQKSYELLAHYGCFAREICDKCGIVLGAVRFTRPDESEVYCSRECRGHAHRSSTLRPGRPRKYKTHSERRAAKTRQQQVYRSHPNVEKTARIESETKNLQTRKLSLSTIPPYPAISVPETATSQMRERESAGDGGNSPIRQGKATRRTARSQAGHRDDEPSECLEHCDGARIEGRDFLTRFDLRNREARSFAGFEGILKTRKEE